MSTRIGVDIGGTFTDCVGVRPDGAHFHAKTLSTHHSSPAEGVMTGVELLSDKAGCSPQELLAETVAFGHGTTIGTNLVVERKGARVALFTTAGSGDAILIMRGNGRTAGLPPDQVFALHQADKPQAIVPRRRIIELDERIDVTGTVLAPLDAEAVGRAFTELLEREQVDAVAVALLWSFRNPAHELMVRDVVRAIDPTMHVSLSHEVASRQGEYERTVATVINAYVAPASGAYLDDLADRLATAGLSSTPVVMQANGGVTPVSVAKEMAVATIGSGPAGGLMGAATLAKASDHPNVIATDMGGTSFDVGLIVDGEPIISSTAVIDRYTYLMPQIDIQSIACGGGSLARADEHARAIRVGPESAGSYPGPACYGNGGDRPTVTDADVVLGLLDPTSFLEGRMPLDAERARAAVEAVGSPLGLTIEETAAGIIRVNNHAAATLIRQRTINAGRDPRDFVVYAFGGAGPVHAFGFAAELSAQRVVIPLGNGASTLSAYGIASTDETRYFERECQLRTPLDHQAMAELLAELEASVRAAMPADGVVLEHFALMRYAEQLYNEIPRPIPDGLVTAESCAQLEESFTAEYQRLYGEGAVAVFQAIEVFGLRIRARVPAPRAGSVADATSTGAATPKGSRPVYWPNVMDWVDTAVFDGRSFGPGATAVGPAVIELPHTTVSVAPGQAIAADASGNLTLDLDAGEPR